MTLTGTLVKQVTIKSDGDVFHEIYRYRPHNVSDMSPGNIKGVDLISGEWGTVGSVIVWHILHDGKTKTAKEVLETIDESKKLLCFKVIGGDVMDAYKTFSVTIQVETLGEESVVTWTFCYEKLNESIEDPDGLMELCLNCTKDIETHHLSK